MIDCQAFQGVGLPEMIKKIGNKPYNYRMHIAPHDIRVRELGSGTSRLDTATSLGVHFDIAPSLGLQDGIQATRQMLSHCVIDREKCKDSINAHRLYRTQYDEKRQVFNNAPLHDWTSDYCDSSRYYAITPKQPIRFDSGPLDFTVQDRFVI
jgi:hypothetical protein